MSFEVRLRWIGFWVPTLASCSIYRLRVHYGAAHVYGLERKAEKNRKKQGAASTTNAGEGHVLKQRRVSTYFRMPILVDDNRYDQLAARVGEIGL
ncbi:hypothetical protein Bca4012_049488 [Brassica carinata]